MAANITSYPIRIEVCGGIASGKTTLANLLGQQDLKPIFENFQVNPFLEIFYSDPDKYAFETEVTFLLQHYNQIKINNENSKILICDFSFYLDLAYSGVTLDSKKFRTFKTVYDEIREDIDLPNLLIYLHCSASTELKRIRSRNRAMEQSITLDFLEKLNESLKSCVETASIETQILEIDSDQFDFAHDVSTQIQVINLVKQHLNFT
jgi:deoxyadenosine/deoxycytidine kinase